MFTRLFSEVSGTEWCCSLFSEAASTESPEGLNIVVAEDQDRNNCFALQFRAVAESDQDTIVSRIGYFEKPVVLKWRKFINFCPWCGKDLRKFYKIHIFIKAKKLDSFINPIPEP